MEQFSSFAGWTELYDANLFHGLYRFTIDSGFCVEVNGTWSLNIGGSNMSSAIDPHLVYDNFYDGQSSFGDVPQGITLHLEYPSEGMLRTDSAIFKGFQGNLQEVIGVIPFHNNGKLLSEKASWEQGVGMSLSYTEPVLVVLRDKETISLKDAMAHMPKFLHEKIDLEDAIIALRVMTGK